MRTEPCLVAKRTGQISQPGFRSFFYFFIFYFRFLQKYIFNITIYSFVPLRPQGGGRGPAARQEGGRDLFVNKKIICADALGGSLPPGRGAAGSPAILLWPLDVF